MAKLKVFTWSDGFHAYTVATTSRTKALAAWGVSRDLFKDGDAKEIANGDDHDAALAAPGETIRRGLSVDVGRLSKVAKTRGPDKAALARVTTLERELANLTADRDADVARLDDERRRLDEKLKVLQGDFDDKCAVLEAELTAARRKLDAT